MRDNQIEGSTPKEQTHMNQLKDQKRGRLAGNSGFTLIEILIAMAIFSIGILAVGNMQLGSTNGNTSSRIRTEASIWAQDRVETLMLLSYFDPLLDPGVHAAAPIPNAPNYSLGYTVWDNAGGAVVGASTAFLNGITPTPKTKIIEVTVTGRGNRANTLVFVRGEDVQG
jgi:prepilin-type N-terminal cleavage/methylation domain-containing protein